MKRPSNRIVALIAAGTVVAGAGAAIGVAASGGSSPAADLAAALNKNKGTSLTEADITQAQADVFKARLDEAVKAGRLTQAQADQMLQRFKDGPPFRGEFRGGHMGRGAVLTSTAKLLGLTADALHAKLHEGNGTTLAKLAADKGIAKAKLLEAVKADLTAGAKAAGVTIPTDRLDEMAARIADGAHPRGRGGKGFGRHGGGPGPMPPLVP